MRGVPRMRLGAYLYYYYVAICLIRAYIIVFVDMQRGADDLVVTIHREFSPDYFA